MKIGIISDTHSLLRPEVYKVFNEMELILHAGDIGERDIIIELEAIAPVYAVLGNNDYGLPYKIKEHQIFQLQNRTIQLQHIFKNVPKVSDIPKTAIKNIIVFGHSHKPFNKHIGDTLYFNPGSAGPRRFKFPVTVGRMQLLKSRVEAEIISLPP